MKQLKVDSGQLKDGKRRHPIPVTLSLDREAYRKIRGAARKLRLSTSRYVEVRSCPGALVVKPEEP